MINVAKLMEIPVIEKFSAPNLATESQNVIRNVYQIASKT